MEMSVDELIRDLRVAHAKIEEGFMLADERDLWADLEAEVERRAEDGEPVTGEWILASFAARVRS